MRLLFLLLFTSSITANAQDKIFYFKQVKKQFASTIKDKELIIVGEVHGTKEAPDFIYLLARGLKKSGRKIKVGLEIDKTYQTSLDSFTLSGDYRILQRMPFFASNAKDGRSSEAMAKLIGDIRKLKGVDVFFFRQRMNTSQENDSMMAINIQKQLNNKSLVIVLVGNMHAKKTPVSFSPGASFRPMAYFMNQSANTKFIALNTIFASGTAWTEVEGEDEPKVRTMSTLTNWINKWGKKSHIRLTAEREGYDGWIYFPKATASMPLVK